MKGCIFHNLWRRCSALLLLLCACSPLVPATSPPQLQHTPGAYITITDSRFDASLFRLDYPSTWRVVKTSTADSPMIQVVFVAPDQSTVVLTQVENANTAGDDGLLLLANGVALKVQVQAADGDPASFAAQAEQLVASIRS